MLVHLALFIMVGTAAGVLSWWAVDRQVPMTVVHAEAINKNVVPGGTVLVRYNVVRHRSCAVRLEQVIFDADRVRYPLEIEEYFADPGPIGEEHFAVPISVPHNINPGVARYRAFRQYQCNPLHYIWPIEQITWDVPFNVERK